MPLVLLDIWETTWRVPNEPLFLVGLIIVGWGLASGLLAFTGSQRSGRPDIHFPVQPPEPAAEPDEAGAGEDGEGGEDQTAE